MGAKSRKAQKIRQAAEFDIARLSAALQPPAGLAGAYSWDLPAIVCARNAQMAGYFHQAARLAESMRTDDAIHVARGNRLAPLKCLKVKLHPVGGARGASVAAEADALFGQGGIAISPDTMHDIHDCFVMHSVAFAVAVPVPREDGSRVDYTLSYWPIEWVRWDPWLRAFRTQTFEGPEETIVHGDGRWVIFQEGEYTPFKNGAILAAAMIWAAHAFALRDWAKGSVAHGNAKIIGALPEGVPIQKDAGLSAEADALLRLMRDLMNGDSPVGIKPAGSTVEVLANMAAQWQIFVELVGNREKAAARLFLGTDGILGAAGGAPGVDISALFGVATTKVQGDITTIERALQTGLIEIWTAVNFGDSKFAPLRRYCMPDADADALKKSLADRQTAFDAAIKAKSDSGLTITQEYVDGLAADFCVRSFKVVAAQDPKALPASDTTAAAE